MINQLRKVALIGMLGLFIGLNGCGDDKEPGENEGGESDAKISLSPDETQVYTGEDSEVKFRIIASDDFGFKSITVESEDLDLSEVVELGSGKTDLSELITINVPATATIGDYVLNITLEDVNGNLAEKEFELEVEEALTIPSTTGSSIRSDGVLLDEGEPFFPFGMYNFIFAWEGELADRLTGLQRQIDAGFNSSHIILQPIDHRADIFDLAEQNNLRLFASEPNGANLKLTIPWIKDEPSIFGYGLADDADDPKHPVSELQEFQDQAKALDDQNITYVTLTGYNEDRQSRAADYVAVGDVAGVQMYPITPLTDYYYRGPEHALTDSYIRALRYVKAGELSNPPKAVLWNCQAFAWVPEFGFPNTQPDPRYPTLLEMRNMFYAGIAAGMKGFAIYSYSDELYENKELWSELETMVDDMNLMDDVYMNGKLTRVNTSDSELIISHWEYQSKLYAMAINTSYTADKKVSKSLPYFGEIKPLIERFSDGLTIEDGKLTGTLPAQAVELYVVEP